MPASELEIESSEIQATFDFIEPYEYQREIFSQIENQWFGDDSEIFAQHMNPYGSIVYLTTGSGKTMIAIMTILRYFELLPR